MSHHCHKLGEHDWHQEVCSHNKQIHRHGDFTWHFKTDAGWTLHNEDGPAQITSNSKEWFKLGKVHREDGPARMFKNDPQHGKFHCEWWFEGKFQASANLDEETFMKHWGDD